MFVNQFNQSQIITFTCTSIVVCDVEPRIKVKQGLRLNMFKPLVTK